jgi:hypothetical protein
VPPEGLLQRGGGSFIDTVGQVDADDLGTENGADRGECV